MDKKFINLGKSEVEKKFKQNKNLILITDVDIYKVKLPNKISSGK